MTDEENRKMNMERLKVYWEILSNAVRERYKLLPQISALSATLLIVATFNEKVIPLTNYVRLLIILFLLLIPISIIGYLVNLYQAENHAIKKIKEITSEELPKKFSFIAYLPWGIAGILSVLIIFVAFLVWQGMGTTDLSGFPCYKNGDIATIEIRGEIIPYFLYTSNSEKIDDPDAYDVASSEEIVFCINDIQKDDNIKNVIIEIDSIGGSPFASEEIMNAIKGLNKPTAAVIRESAVSGGYLIATAADRIFASELSDIGGIGVTMSYLDYSQKNAEEGIIYQQLSSGKFKDAGDPDRPLTDEERELFMRDNKIMHEAFIINIATNRSLDIEKVIKLANGSSMLGAMAKENGLIDEIGDINSAENWLNSGSL